MYPVSETVYPVSDTVHPKMLTTGFVRKASIRVRASARCITFSMKMKCAFRSIGMSSWRQGTTVVAVEEVA